MLREPERLPAYFAVLSAVALVAFAPSALADAQGNYGFSLEQVPGSSGVTFIINACPSVTNPDGSSGPKCPQSGYLTLTRGGAVIATSPTYTDLRPNGDMKLGLAPGGLHAGDRVDAYLNGVDSWWVTFSGAPTINISCGGYTITGRYDPQATLSVERLSHQPGSESDPQALTESGGSYTASFSDPVTAAQDFETYTTDGGDLSVAVYTGAECPNGGSGAPPLTTPPGEMKPTQPRVKITRQTISRKHHNAQFAFRSTGLSKATGFQCALIKQPKTKGKPGVKARKPHFTRCRSTKTYKHLKNGKYTFEVRALAGLVSGSAVKRTFVV